MARICEKHEQLQNYDTITFRYEFYVRQNIIVLCYIWMKSPKSLDRFRRCCYNTSCCRGKTWWQVGNPKGFQVRKADCPLQIEDLKCGTWRSLKTIQRKKRQGKQNSQISERETPVGVEVRNTLASDPSGGFEQDKGLNIRVWSWLRTNAGGVLNTCKSNGDLIGSPSGRKVRF